MRLPIRIPMFLRGLGLLPILAVTVVLAPLLPVPMNSVRWHGMQTVGVEIGGVVLLTAVLCRPWPKPFGLPSSLRQISLLCLHGLLLWALVSCGRDPNPFAVQSLLMLGFGVFTADVVAAQITDQRRMAFLVYALLLAAVLVCGLGLVGLGSATASLASGPLHDHQLFGAFMTLPLLFSLALSFGGGTQTQRLLGQVAFLLCILGLLEAQHRSAWIGAAVSLVVFGGLSLLVRSRGRRASSMPRLVVPAALATILLLGFVGASPNRSQLFARFSSIGTAVQERDKSLQWRQEVWAGTRRMIREKPLWGWGIGGFPVWHFPFTHTGRPAAVVQQQGPGLEDEAYNSYLQLWAELGIVGLLLWLATLGLFLAGGVRALKRYPARSPAQWALIGCLSAIVGQMVDAFANPAWQFGQVALPLWLVLGLTAALTRPAEAAPRHRHMPKTPAALPVRLGQAVLAAVISAGLLWLIWRTAFALPAPRL